MPKHRAVYNPHQLWWLFNRRGWVDNFAEAQKRFGCNKCRLPTGRRSRAAVIALTDREVTVDDLSWPYEREWKQTA